MTQPPPPLPPLYRDQRRTDVDHLRILSLCHYIGAGLSAVGLGFLYVHYTFMRAVFEDPQMWQNSKNGPPPEAFTHIMHWFYLVGAIFLVSFLVLNVLSAVFIQKRQYRMFSLIVAGLNCIHVPLGTALGVFTFVVLLRESVREVYEAAE